MKFIYNFSLVQTRSYRTQDVLALVGVWGFGIGLGLAFPIVIGFVPLRAVLLTKVFPAQYLELLDRQLK
jgi:hypothetical protein